MSADSTHRYLICYDIVDDPRRARLAKALQSFGDRVQFSVFLIDAKPAKLVRLRSRIRTIIAPDNDSVLICSLGPTHAGANDAMEFLGRQRPLTEHGPLIA